MLTYRRFHRSLTGALLAAALSMPAICSGAVMADQFADATAPVDDPATPGPDLYAGRNFDLIPGMPDPVAMDVAFAPVPLPSPAEAQLVVAVAPAREASRRPEASPARGPPAR